MANDVVQTRRFASQYKKLHDNIAVDVDQAVVAIANNPEFGERKKRDLAEYTSINSAVMASFIY
ncbi:MAG: type II toxin-antitoxin system RelE/ParE family toxin [Methylovulum sp.]|uniref:type II toxin-antitoxin system RelE/ParE family toxin n=1 Tax=Methylovulum sp. TaxID=1916980 RepID=UPI0026091435|nr:type II toxin-antitoxin system RelE/ParE family toxin [Methylovulum sp.]MDD2722970.1 type II toxin-antitoxin system RelE/ParE family toxin [Methylovulum sp.]MDD5123283.1 type II toxin-antitoxin system RelE/ParE family toxin [Methylovulum sp.]